MGGVRKRCVEDEGSGREERKPRVEQRKRVKKGIILVKGKAYVDEISGRVVERTRRED